MEGKIIIVQEKIPAYRIPVFRELAKLFDSLKIVCRKENAQVRIDEVTVIGLDVIEVRGFKYFIGLKSALLNADAVIFEFDLKMLQLWQVVRNFNCLLWGHGFGRNNNFYLARKARVILAKISKGLVFYSNEGRDAFISEGLPEQKLFVANNSISNREAGLTVINPQAYLFIGRLISSKKIDDVLRGFKKVKELNTKSKLVIIGTGPEESRLKQMIDELGLGDSVQMVGKVYDNAELKKYFQHAIAVVSSCKMGLAIVHSFSFGCPVILRSDLIHGPEVEYCNDRNSLFYDGSVDGLVESMLNVNVSADELKLRQKAAFETYVMEASVERMVAGFRTAINYSLKAE